MMMMIGFYSFLLFSYCCCGIDAFPLVVGKNAKQRTLLHYTNNDNDSSWSFEHDCTLLEQVPIFTVGEHSQIRTFWTQLAASTPIFADKDPEELYQRCQQLLLLSEEKRQNNNNEEAEIMTKGGNDDTTSSLNLSSSSFSRRRPLLSLLLFGPSPPLLQNWHIERKEQSSLLTEVIGQTIDGRTIWLQYHCIGRLQGDPLSTKFATAQQQQSPSSLLPGGYIESIGGRVYELGQPQITTTTMMIANSKSTATAVATKDVVPTIINKSDNHLFPWFNNNQNFDDNEKNNPFHSIISATSTATFSALLASSILSAFIGFGAGVSIVSDAYSPSSTPPCVYAMSSSTTAQQQQSIKSITAAVVTPSPSTTTAMAPSFHELRASKEYKVLREQRLLREISQQLEKDWVDFRALRLAENQMPN